MSNKKHIVPQILLTEGGPQVSRVALGFWRLKQWKLAQTELLNMIKRCVDLGITTFDHADVYGDYSCEELFGKAIAKDPSLRNRVQLITKCGIKLVSQKRPENTIKHYDTSKKHILTSVENSLKKLNTDRIDLLLIHRPDPLMDPETVAEAFRRLKQSGKVLYFGVSNFMPWQFDFLASRLDFPLVTNQVEFSVMCLEALENGVIDQCQRQKISPIAWSPFGGGNLFLSKSRQAVRLRKVLDSVGKAIGGASRDQVALAWILTHPAKIVPVIGTGRWDRIETAVGGVGVKLTREQWFTIWRASKGKEVP